MSDISRAPLPQQKAGFRPCLRCRPECSPGTPAWAGTQNTISRALRLISETGWKTVVWTAWRNNLEWARAILRRLFLRHLGARPVPLRRRAVCTFAKKLIDETTLPMTQIAFAAGFGSVRRFNATIRNVYHRTPTQIRGLAQKMFRQPEKSVSFSAELSPTLRLETDVGILRGLRHAWVGSGEGEYFRRAISLNENRGIFRGLTGRES